MSPSSRPVNGPASSIPSSTTRTPASGPGPFMSRAAAGASVAASVIVRLFRVAHAGDEDVTGLVDMLLHHQLGALAVARLERFCDLPVVVRGDLALLDREPDVGAVDERQLDHLADELGDAAAARGVED